ncbi:MAG: ABC transporter substrate-binding protein, partial [Cyanobium sp. LacPavin_0920_WC12_MAG_62_9]|nr:ABC transporter substrate-binding protein [Cyanobium sp. LacPavin_0920_WC12_MAG_62_9]
MTSMVTIDNVTQTFPLQDGGQYVALKDISLEIKEGEFVSLIGHSGCGKSTLLNLLAGLTLATKGGILMDGRQVTTPGPDRMVVFQNYSLLPWQTVRQNIELAVTNVLRHLSSEERRELVDKQLKTVGLSAAADKFPRELSGGMKNLPRPRQRLEVMEHPDYYRLRIELIGFLQQQRRTRQRRSAAAATMATAPSRTVTVVRLGYLPGLDVAPLAMAIDSQLFDPAVVQVVPESFADWRRLEERLVDGGLDMAITSATTPLQLNLGLGNQPGQKRTPWAAITPMTVSRNGNALCLARHLLDLGIEDRASLVEWIQAKDKPFTIGIPQHHGIAELLLRHWLTAGGLNVEEHIAFTMLSPLTMVGALRTGAIDAFCAGRYRVAEAVEDRQGYVLATDLEIWSGHPEKVLTTSEAWAAANPEALVAICSGLMQAAARCDNGNQREEMTRVLSQPQWLGTRSAIALTRQF